jgi:hypothetical protein
MVGNLQVFQGAERLNAYGHLLHGPLNEVLWAVRVVLVLALVLHVVAAGFAVVPVAVLLGWVR